MNIVRHDPWSVFDRFNREFNALLQSRPGAQDNAQDDSSIVTSRWVPAVDIKEDADKFVLIADIPGVDPKDIEITMNRSVLTIKGERHDEKRDEADGYTRLERTSGLFYRRFSLPDSADDTRISAKGEHGVLTITIPKKEQAQPRRIAVEA
ncbi:MAG: Hsp20/alpha crystallin family protein [Gammaproteobacteria bacterium]